MKRFFALLLCLAFLVALGGCLFKDEARENASLSGIETAKADPELKGTEPGEPYNPDRTVESDREEIEANLRDARELIEQGYFEDATMIIDSLKTRKLTSAEKKEIKELQKMMIKVSD